MATALTTLANVKAWVKVKGDADDALLARLVVACSDAVASYLNRDLGITAYSETFDGAGGNSKLMPNYPIRSVQSVRVNGQEIPPRPAFGSPGYVFNEYAITLEGYSFARGVANVSVQYQAGYDAPPPDIEQACVEWIADRYAQRDRIGLASKGAGGETTAFSLAEMPKAVRIVLDQRKKVVPV